MMAARKKKWWQWLLAYPTIITGAIGAVPQYTTWAKAYVLNVPWNAVSEAEAQQALWTKNFECSWKEPAQTAKTTVTTSRNERVTITLCPSGDALVAIQPPGAEPQFRWIGFDRFDTGARRAARLDGPPGFWVRPAARGEPADARAGGARGHLRHAGCPGVRRPAPAAGRWECQEQVVNPYTGAVVEVRPSACTKC